MESRIRRALESDPEAGPLLARAPADLALCFAPDGTGVVSGSTLLLNETQGQAQLGARVAHLLHHVAHGQARTSGHAESADEAPAVALEDRVRQRLASR